MTGREEELDVGDVMMAIHNQTKDINIKVCLEALIQFTAMKVADHATSRVDLHEARFSFANYMIQFYEDFGKGKNG